MKKAKKKITLTEAYDRLLARIKAGGPYGYNTSSGVCEYNPKVNGGCAIGCYLTPEEASRVEGDSVSAVFQAFPEIAEKFEQPDLTGWTRLQELHDRLAVGGPIGYDSRLVVAQAIGRALKFLGEATQ